MFCLLMFLALAKWEITGQSYEKTREERKKSLFFFPIPSASNFDIIDVKVTMFAFENTKSQLKKRQI